MINIKKPFQPRDAEFINRVYKYLPRIPYCSFDKTASLILVQMYAVLYPYIQLNNPTQCAWLIFDCDHDDSLIWEKVELLPPSYIATDPLSGRFHLGYAISPVFLGAKARRKPLEYLAAIQRTMTRLLKADNRFVGLITKNPIHTEWQVKVFHNKQYDLGELHQSLGELDKKHYGETITADLVGYERNCELFHVLRYHAYARIKLTDELNYEQWYEYLSDQVKALNEAYRCINVEPLTEKEVMGIAKSVSRWTWQRKARIFSKERKLQLDESQPLATRQAIGAYHSHEVRKEASQLRIEQVIAELKMKGVKVTQKTVAELSGLGTATIKRHWRLLIK